MSVCKLMCQGNLRQFHHQVRGSFQCHLGVTAFDTSSLNSKSASEQLKWFEQYAPRKEILAMNQFHYNFTCDFAELNLDPDTKKAKCK